MKIYILDPEEARRIAAGEVIDRPASLIREFLDNSIDAGSLNIDLSIEGGGIKKIEAADDGCGMDRSDLEICFLTHATSKIKSLEDLNISKTLGFRGEALAAAATVSRLEIISSTGEGEAWRLETGPGENNPPKISSTARAKGTTVRSLNLYDTLPARKKFLKREGSEGNLCRQAFLEKALVFPEISFRFFNDGKPRDCYIKANSKLDRFADVLLESKEKTFLHEIHVSGKGFTAEIIFGGPEISRNDRRMQYIFANGRLIQDYSLMQALEYGVQGWFPGGTHPVGSVYIDIDPSLADFNIHPAKREARFKEPALIHHAISEGLGNYVRRYTIKNTVKKEHSDGDSLAKEVFFASSTAHAPASFPASAMDIFLSHDKKSFVSEDVQVYGEPKFAGRVFDLFILIEWGDNFYIIDHHAAHERILYNLFLEKPIPKQDMLVPIVFETESPDDDNFLELKKDQLAKLAIEIEKDGKGWRIDSLPAGWAKSNAETVKDILELRNSKENAGERWAMTLACHKAVKDNDFLDDKTAFALAKDALLLPDPHCPHGRPIWTKISKAALLKAVKRN